jgi:hypothetical protein
LVEEEYAEEQGLAINRDLLLGGGNLPGFALGT